VLRDRLTDKQIESFHLWLKLFGEVAPKWEEGRLVIEGSAADFGLDPEEDGLPRVSLRLIDEKASPSNDWLATAIERAVGWVPRHHIDIDAWTSATYNHVLVGRISAQLAEQCDGLIHLGTVCSLDDSETRSDLPPDLAERLGRFGSLMHPEDRDDATALFRAASASGELLDPVWKELGRQYENRVRKRIANMPGKVFELLRPGGEVDSYLVDHAFMRSWLKDPEFHIG
jgi:hypothetical protein